MGPTQTPRTTKRAPLPHARRATPAGPAASHRAGSARTAAPAGRTRTRGEAA